MAEERSKKIKIALLVGGALALSIFGFNFLKGNSFFSSDRPYHAVFNSAKGLGESNKLMLLGVEVGKVESIEFIENYEKVKVNFLIDGSIQIPEDSKVLIDPGIPGFGSPALKLQLGDSKQRLKAGARVNSITPVSMSDKASELVNDVEPVVTNLNVVLKRLDSVAVNVNRLTSGANATNLEQSIANLNATLYSLNQTSKNVNDLVRVQSVNVDRTFSNLNSISGNLASKESQINQILDDFSTTSTNLSQVELQQTLDKANETFTKLNGTIDKINDGDGSLSLLINDAELYNNLNDAARDLDRLILDLKENPNVYIPNISVFGGKKK